MSAIPRLIGARRDWRLVSFRIVASLIAVGLFLADGIDIVAPWIDLTSYSALEYRTTMQRWHSARWSAYSGILFTGSLAALLWRPRAQPLLIQFLILSGAALALIGAPFAPFMSALRLATAALLALTYPDRAALPRLARSASPPSRSLLALSLLAAALLAIDAWRSIAFRLSAAGSYAPGRHWIEAIMLAVALALAGLLASTKRPGWQALGLLTGAALIYLGLAAAKLPDQAGAWGAALATLGGWAFVAATAWEARRVRKESADWRGTTGLISK
jgi:hypothetical protein